MPKPSPDIYKRARGFGILRAHLERQEREFYPIWKPVPGFPEYEVNQRRQVQRVTTKAPVRPYSYPLRPNDGEFVDFWISGQRHAISLDAIMIGAFPEEDHVHNTD